MDTDAFPIGSLDSLRVHEFTLAFDNLVNPNLNEPKRLNNGIILATNSSQFLSKWINEYHDFDTSSWAKHSSEIPFFLATQYPDLIHVEWSRLSPISYGFQTAEAAAALTCGILDTNQKRIIYPKYSHDSKSFIYDHDGRGKRLYTQLVNKLVLHLTMSGER